MVAQPGEEAAWVAFPFIQLGGRDRLADVRALFKPQRPHIGEPIPATELNKWEGNPRGFLAWLREHTLALGR